jgi:hypothetical protein
MRRIITITRTIHHSVDILTDTETEAEARRVALEMAGEDVRYWDRREVGGKWVLRVKEES